MPARRRLARRRLQARSAAPPHRAVVDGDTKSAAIAAASIVAKVTRDRYMRAADALYPGYGFASHVGYITPAHTRDRARARAVRDPPPLLACACLPQRRRARSRLRSERPRGALVPPALLPHARHELLARRRTRSTSSRAAAARSSFCEVKSKSGAGFGDPLEMVDAREGAPRAACGGGVDRAHPEAAGLEVRFDVIAERAGRFRASAGRVLGGPAAAANWSLWAHAGSRSTRARPRSLVVGARAPRARAHEARPSPAPVSRQVRAAARGGALPAPRSRARARARSVRRLGDDARAGARERSRLRRRRHRRVQLPLDAREDGAHNPFVLESDSAMRLRASSGGGAHGPSTCVRARVVRAAGARRPAALSLADRRLRARRRAADRACPRRALCAADDALRPRLPEGSRSSRRTGASSTSASAALSTTRIISCGATRSTRSRG